MQMQAQSSQIPRQTVDEHLRIVTALVEMTRSVEKLDPTNYNPYLFGRIRRQIRKLVEQLSEHFRGEAQSGLHEKLLLLVPDAEYEVGRLIRDHAEILDSLETAYQISGQCTPMNIEKLRDELEMLLDRLYSHEVAEDQLMIRAFDNRES